eukprot:TRINITY_DN1165_c1_g1_i1.p1 TRINITY_DN1165_c1_g1~~TRINITY_DN1165_c1_g1_i1.p1  ORF type:complete len:306 (+),score=75.27 TRINITY_DN1165_c1_g1_i1:126-1043(+)
MLGVFTGCAQANLRTSAAKAKASAGSKAAGKCNVPIIVRTLAGRELQLNSDPAATVEGLKLRIAEEIGVPTLCQRLVDAQGSMLTANQRLEGLDSLKADSAQRFQTHAQGEVLQELPAVLTVLVCLDDAKEGMRAKSADKQLYAVEALEAVIKQGHEHARPAIDSLVESFPLLEVESRRAAAKVVAKAAESNAASSTDVLALARDSDAEVRTSMVTALSANVAQGDALAAEQVATSLNDANLKVRGAALDAFAKVAWSEDNSLAVSVVHEALRAAAHRPEHQASEQAKLNAILATRKSQLSTRRF